MTDNYATPLWIKELFKEWYDPCPLNPNPEINGLNIVWLDRTFVNPPYSKPLEWVLKAIEESKKGKTIVMLLRVDTSTRWFKELINAKAHILFFNERLHFIDTPANFPSMLVVLEATGKGGK